MTALPDVTAFPDVRWGRDRALVRHAAAAFSSSRLGSSVVRALTPLDRRLLQRSRGRYTVLGPIGLPTLLLTTTGRKSGLRRTSPLLYHRRADGTLIVVGSNFGQAHHPAWTANLLADPHAVVAIGGREVPALATRLTGDDAAAAYAAMSTVLRTYDVYRGRTDREIRVFRLAPAAPAGTAQTP